MTATQLRYRRYLKQTRSALAIAEFFREYPHCEFTFTDRSVTIFAKELDADLADICEIAGFDLVVDGPDPAPRYLNLH